MIDVKAVSHNTAILAVPSKFVNREPVNKEPFFGIERTYVSTTEPPPSSDHQVRMEFA